MRIMCCIVPMTRRPAMPRAACRRAMEDDDAFEWDVPDDDDYEDEEDDDDEEFHGDGEHF